jgi:FtsH-binding integral membrane protein
LSDRARLRARETRLAAFTLVAAALFALLETIATVQMFGAAGVVHPGFFGSVAGVALLVVGAVRSLKARPRRAPALLCASHAWWTGVGWHAVGLRYQVWSEGRELFYGSIDLWGVALAALVATVMFGASALLVLKAEADAPS